MIPADMTAIHHAKNSIMRTVCNDSRHFFFTVQPASV
jgi:hypothetical protein